MNARTMNPKAVVAAAMMMVAAVTVSAASAGAGLGLQGYKVGARVVARYAMSAWTAPAAVVLESEADWNAWAQDMAASRMAIDVEPAPAGVDWKREAVLVVALGDWSSRPMGVDLASVDRVALHTDVNLAVGSMPGMGAYPAVIVALPRQTASAVRLTNGVDAGLPTAVPVYSAIRVANGTNGAGQHVAASWGEVKDAYRQ